MFAKIIYTVYIEILLYFDNNYYNAFIRLLKLIFYCRINYNSVLELMYEKSKDCITKYEGRFKALPIHAACGYGKLDAAKKLLEWNRDTLEKPSLPVILPAFTLTTELKQVDLVQSKLSDYELPWH